ncbi:MAG: Crp/Fnr family transcriptional regulator [Bacteroidia bacterium]
MESQEKNCCSDCNLCFVQTDSIFSILTLAEMDELQADKSTVSFNYGELIFKEKLHPSGIYIILEGSVKIFKNGFEGKEHIVRFSKKGDILGYRSLLSGGKYSCSATAISNTRLCYLSGELIFKLIKNNPELSLRFMNLLAHDLKIAEQNTINMVQKPVRERIAQTLLLLKEFYGFELDNATINISLKRDELASIAGTSRETAIRLLFEFCDDEIISITGRKIKIYNLDKLIKIANQSF